MIQCLPNELLGDLFCSYVALDDSPWRLTLVCRRWRGVALSTPNLWTRITIVDTERLGDTRWRVHGTEKYSYGRELVCRNTGDVREAVHLAGILLLHVIITCHSLSGNGDNLEALMREIFCPTVAIRVLALNIDIHPYLTFTTECFTLPDGEWGSFSNLVSLELHLQPRYWLGRLFKVIYTSSANSLRSLRIPRTVPEDQINDIMAVSTQLEQLDSRAALWPFKATPSMKLLHMKQLKLTCPSRYLGLLHLPRVQILVLHDVWNFRLQNDEPSHAELPQLIDFHVITRHTKWLEDIIAPRLQVLSISTTELATNPPFLLFTLKAFPTVKNFTFETGFDSEEGRIMQQSLLISALQAVPNAVNVKIITECMAILDPEPRIEFLDKLGAIEDTEEMCPRLRDLELVSHTRSRSDLDEYEVYMLHRIVDTRKQMGRDLTRFIFKWTNSAGELISQRYV